MRDDEFGYFDGEDEDDMEGVVKFEQMIKNNDHLYFDADELEEIVNHYLFEGDLDHANLAAQHALLLHSNTSTAHFITAQVKFEEGAFKLSMEHVNQAIDIDGGIGEFYILKGQIYTQIEDRVHAVQCYLKAADLLDDEEAQSVLLDAANTYQEVEMYEEAVKVLKRIIKEYPDNTTALYELAFCYDVMGLVDDSIEFYQKFLDDDPYSFVSWYNLGNAFCKKNDFQSAISAFDFAIVIKDDLSAAHFNKGNALTHLGRYKEAIEAFEESMNHEGCQAITLNYIGECYEKLKEYDKALSHFEHACELDPELSEPWIGRGIIMDIQGEKDLCLEYLNHAITIDDENAANWVVLGNAHEKHNELDLAEEAYRKSISLNNQLVEAWVDLAALLQHRKRDAESIEELFNAIKACPEHKTMLEYRLVAYLFKAGKQAEAMTYLEDALKINFGGHKELLEYCPEIFEKSEFVKMIENYSK